MNPRVAIPWIIIVGSGIFEAGMGGVLLTIDCHGIPAMGIIFIILGFATFVSAYALPIDERSDKEKAEQKRWREHRFEGVTRRGINASQGAPDDGDG